MLLGSVSPVSAHSEDMKATTVGIIGDFNPANSTHLFTDNAIQHAAQILDKSIETVWLPTDKPVQYNDFQGLFGSPGSPYRSFAGALSGICYAREHKIPFIGTCGGFQHLLIEYARNVMGMKDAAHAESDPYASCLFVTPLICSLVGKRMDVMLKPGSKAAFACRAIRSTESYYCNFGLNPAYQERLEFGRLRDYRQRRKRGSPNRRTPRSSVLLGNAFCASGELDGRQSSSAHPGILPVRSLVWT